MSIKITVRDIAGLCPEKAIWKMMADVSTLLLEGNVIYNISPDTVTIDGDMFIVEAGQGVQKEYVAPESIEGDKPDMKQIIWSLGAVIYFAATGHVIFGGHGSYYQKENPSVSLPVLPKNLQKLTAVLHKCICCNPEERISMIELKEVALKGLASCEKRQRIKSDLANIMTGNKDIRNGEKWPEEMIEI